VQRGNQRQQRSDQCAQHSNEQISEQVHGHLKITS
jgi:hypothetical protein